MATYIRKHWTPTFEGPSRRDRGGCEYDAYLPDPLQGWQFTLPGDAVADLSDAEAAVAALNTDGTAHTSLEGMARFLLRAESVASSKIEGIEAGPRRLVEAEAAIIQGGNTADRAAAEILGNIHAMESVVSQTSPVTVERLLEVHRKLMSPSPTPDIAGVIRTQQNWIGGSSYNPCRAAYVPPPPDHVPTLLADLAEFANADDHAPLVQAAIAHAQFETIHPFADGNGRAGRALIHIILRKRGLSPTFVPPISLVLATWSSDYIEGLTRFRHVTAASSAERSEAAHTWIRTFTAATHRACADARIYAERIERLTMQWRAAAGRIRSGSALDLILGLLPGSPLLTVSSASTMIKRSEVAVSSAINRLVDTGVLVQRNVGRQRYRVFEAPDVLALFTAFERALASPAGDTAISAPVRRVPLAQDIRPDL